MRNETSKRLHVYDLTVRDLRDTDLGKLHELSVGVGWPHRPADLRLLMRLGRGLVGCDEIGRVVASAMWFPMGEDFATIGMVITSPRLQALGAGRWMMKHVLRECGDRFLRLNTTRAAYRLYESLSFVPVATVWQCQGEAIAPGKVSAPEGGRIRAVRASDFPRMLELDQAAYGADRAKIYDVLREFSKGTALERNGHLAGFALCRRFGRGHLVGPIVARDDADAIALTAPHVASHAGRFLRVDTVHGDSEFSDYLIRCGLSVYDTVTTMTLGTRTETRSDMQIFGLAAHTLG